MKISVTRLRKRLGVTQKKFAKMMGVHHITVLRWEKKSSEPKKQSIRRMLVLRRQLDKRSKSA